MADERYEWLDADAAERLLRGEPVRPVGDRARSDAQRLAAALSEAGAVPPAGAELPGEAAVLAAFRDASRAGRRDGAGVRRAALNRPAAVAGPTDQPGTLRTVRVGATRTAPSRGPRWSHPLRYGLVVSLAGCALGGVAVAAGTGMLPEVFGGRHSPAPAASVSVAASPEGPGSGLPSEAAPSVSAPAPPGTSGSSAPALPSDAPETGTSTGGSGPTRGPDSDGGVPERGGDREGAEGAADGDRLPDGSAGGDSREVYEKSVQACRDHRDDTLDGESRRRLVRLARGERNLDRFCDRILEGDGRSGEGAGDGGPGTGDGGGDTGEGGGKDPEEGGGGSLPSVSFEMAPSAAGPTGDAPARTDGDDTSGSRALPSATPPAAPTPSAH